MKEIDIAVRDLIIEILNNISAEDVLRNAGLKMNGSTKRSANSAIKKVKSLIAAFGEEAEISITGTKYNKSYVKNVRTAESVRLYGRVKKDGSQTEVKDWGGYELLSYFLELYYRKTGKEYPIEGAGVTYYIRKNHKWEPRVTRGLGVMTRLIRILGGPENAKAYIEWWFTTNINNKPISWGWLSSPTAIVMFQSQLSKASSVPTRPVPAFDQSLPEEFIAWAESVDNIHKYISSIKTYKQLVYLYHAWEHRIEDMEYTEHPVIVVLRKALRDGLIAKEKI